MMKCDSCDLKINCEMASKGLEPPVVPCDHCRNRDSEIYREPCVYCHVFSMDEYCKFESNK